VPTATQTATFTATATGTAAPTSTLTATATATVTATATDIPQTPWIVTVPVVVVIQNQNQDSTTGGSGSSGGSLSSYAMTPTPPTTLSYTGSGGSACAYALRTFVYVDNNDDNLMSPDEGADGLEVVFMEASYSRLGSRYTREGQAVFCLPPALYGRTVRVQIPYLHQAQDVQIPASLHKDVEVWFRLKPPTLPLYLP
jgi:hypothetical protein